MGMQDKVCGNCKYHDSERNICTNVKDYELYAGKNSGACHGFTKPNLFDRITVSHEVLARALCGTVRVGCFSGYYSMLTGMYYPDMEKAYIATLEKLKEV